MIQSKINSTYALATQQELKDFLVLSTCNRTEFYAFAPYPIVTKLIADALNVNDQELDSYFYTYTGIDAARHFSKVVAGLNSQIIGEYEIVGQVKKAVQLARDSGLVGTLMDRISNYAFQASKEIKAQTNLSTGKYSLSYAAAELINKQQNTDCKNILIVGTGEIGQAMARNLQRYFPDGRLTLTNRTYKRACALSEELNANLLPFEKFTSHLNEFDIIITTAESDRYLITEQDVHFERAQLFLDLSIPQVIDPEIKAIKGIKHYSVDEISSFHNTLMIERHLEIPRAELIIEDFIGKLIEWHTVFKNTGIIRTYKEKMSHIICNGGNPRAKIEKSFSKLMVQIKSEGYNGCSVIQTVNELIAAEK